MKSKVFAVSVLTALVLAPPALAQSQNKASQAATLRSFYSKPLEEVERAFYRRQAQLSGTGQRLAAPAALSELLPFGFIGNNDNWVINVRALSKGRSRVCMQMEMPTELLYKAAVQVLGKPGIKRADAACNPLASASTPKWPGTLYVIKDLDSEDVPTRTMLPPSPPISGVSGNNKTLPAFTLVAEPGQWSSLEVFTVVNPAAPALEGAPPAPVLDIVKAQVRPEFHVEHNCHAVPAQHTCSVGVQYMGGTQRYMVGTLQLEFNDGNIAVISLLGRKP